MPAMLDDAYTPPSVHARTRARIQEAVETLGSATRAELIEATGLARATVATGVTQLLESRILVEVVGDSDAGRGRRPMRLELAPPDGLLCVIDMGHGHSSVAVADGAGRVLGADWVESPVDADPAGALQACLARARGLVVEHAAHGILQAVAVIVPQPVAPDARSVIPTPFLTAWHGLEVAELVGAVFDVPVVVENDANAGAIASDDGSVDGLVFVKVSTGVGAGIVAGGGLVRGRNGQAGELGHIVVRADGQLCGCGNRGCLETLASLPAVLRALEPIHGRLDRPGLAHLLQLGDVASARAMRDAGEAIGSAVAPVVAALQTERLVIGGLDGIPLDALIDGVRARIRALIHRDVVGSLTVEAAADGAHAPQRGGFRLAAAAALAAR